MALGSTSPSWSNEDADDFWDDDLGALDDDFLPDSNGSAPASAGPARAGENRGHKSENSATSHEKKGGFGEKEQASSDIAQESQEISSALDAAATEETDGATPDEEADSGHESVHETEKTSEEKGPAINGMGINATEQAEDVVENVPEAEPPVESAELSQNDVVSSETVNVVDEQVESADISEPSSEVQKHDVSEPPEDIPTEIPETREDATEPQPDSIADSIPNTETHKPNGNSKKVGEIPKSSNVPTPQKPDPADSPSNTSEIASLTSQISALKLALEEKDRKLSQMGETSNAPANGDSNLTEKVLQLEENLRQTEQERDHAQAQLDGFLSKISSMKTVFQNFKATQKELEEVRQELAEANEEKDQAMAEKETLHAKILTFESENKRFIEEKGTRESETKKYLAVIESLKIEALDLNSECDRLSQLLGTLRREFQSKEEALQDEKYTLENEVGRLNKKLSEQKNAHSELELEKEEATIENKNLVLALEELKDRLDEKTGELAKTQDLARDSQSLYETKIADLETQIKAKDAESETAHARIRRLEDEVAQAREEAQKQTSHIGVLEKEKEKIKGLEEELHGKQLVIGKLRHEAIILNEHLTKSLSMLKQQSGDTTNTVDRELVSNMILNFLQIPRGDTKKFEALSLIAGLLDWDDPKKVQAGLMHSGKDDKPPRSGLISLWTDFLDKESSKK